MGSSVQFESGLNNWAPADKPAREDFVNDNRVLSDEAMWKKTYDADGTVNRAGGISSYVQGQAVVTGNSIPAGMMAPYGGAAAPAGWLLCRGQAISRATYAELFAAIGTTHGVGDGSTTFNVPNMDGRMPMGFGTGYAVGSKAGSATVAAAALPQHSHSIPALSGATHQGGGAHGHLYYSSWPNPAKSGAANEDKILAGDLMNQWKYDNYRNFGGGDHIHNITTSASTTGAVGSAASMNILNPYLALSFIIKT